MSWRMGWIPAALMLLGVFCQTSAASAALVQPPRDGWVSWNIATVPGAPAWCCFEWGKQQSRVKTCRLDRTDHGYGSDSRIGSESTMRVYARFTAGTLDRLRTLSASCPVETATPLRLLDNISAADSLRWLSSVASPRANSSDDALAAIALHRGSGAARILEKVAHADASVENRKQALFWATQVRGDEGLNMVLPYLFEDKDARVREHAAFAVAQTDDARAFAALARQGRDDASSRVRAQAWFWLAQTGASEAEALIVSALVSEPSRHVREQAVFALSQLPEPRNVAALVRIAEDRSRGREERKQALFWLGQSESGEALRYLDRLLGNKQAMAD